MIGLSHDIVAQAQHHIEPVRHRFDALRIDRLHLVNELENAVQLGLHVEDVGGSNADAGKMRDPLDILGGEAHESEEVREKARAVRYVEAGCGHYRGIWFEAVG